MEENGTRTEMNEGIFFLHSTALPPSPPLPPSRLCSDHGSFKHIKAATCGPTLSGTFSSGELEIEPSFEPTLSWDHLLKEKKKEEGRGGSVKEMETDISAA